MPQYDIRLHPTAKRELDNLDPELREAITDRLTEVATHERPTEHRSVKHLDGQDGLFRVRAQNIRAIGELSKPELRIIKIGQRRTVYRDIDAVTEERLA